MVIDFNDLPSEMVLAIISKLGYGDVSSCMMLNKKIRGIINANPHLISRIWITNVSLEREGPSRFKLSISKASFKSPKKTWACVFNENKGLVTKGSGDDIMEFYNSKGFSGLKWDKANKSTEFDVPSISSAVDEHLSFLLFRANVLCFKSTDLDEEDMRVVARLLRKSRSRISHLQFVVNRPIPQELVSLIDATGAETIDIVMSETSLFRNLAFQSKVFRKAWSVTIHVSSHDENEVLDISDEDLLSLDADTIEFYGRTRITAQGSNKLIQEWFSGRRKIAVVYFRHAGGYEAAELFRGIPNNVSYQKI